MSQKPTRSVTGDDSITKNDHLAALMKQQADMTKQQAATMKQQAALVKQQAALVKQQAALVKQLAALVLVKPNLQPLDDPAPVVNWKSLLKLRMLLLKQYHQSMSFLYCKILVSWRSCLMAKISDMRPNRLVYQTGGFMYALSLNHRLE